MTTTIARMPTFRVRTLMIATAAVALGLWLKLEAPEPLGFLVFWGLALALIARVIPRQGPDPIRPLDRVLFPAVLIAAVAGEWYAARLAFHTLSEMHEAFHVMAIGLNLPAIGLLLGRRRRWAYGWVIAVFLWLVPYQLFLLGKWTMVDREARSVIAYLNAQHAKAGEYPPDLSGYVPGSPIASDWIEYRTDPKMGFVLWYHLGTEMTHHLYQPRWGWFYNPD